VDWVRRTLAELPRREAEVLALTEVVGLDVATTAAVLDMTGTAVRVARHRGLARLRRATPAPVVATTPAAPAGAASATSPVPAQAAPSRLETLLAPETV
jgi:RNA polymerase sigma-70 factor (ECF subfamily)